jgi:hypothetical protein
VKHTVFGQLLDGILARLRSMAPAGASDLVLSARTSATVVVFGDRLNRFELLGGRLGDESQSEQDGQDDHESPSLGIERSAATGSTVEDWSVNVALVEMFLIDALASMSELSDHLSPAMIRQPY